MIEVEDIDRVTKLGNWYIKKTGKGSPESKSN